MRYLVFDIGGTFTKYALMDENAHIQKKGKVPTRQDDQEQFVGMLVDLFEKESPVDGIAISTSGFVEPESGIMHNAGSILCVHELPIVKELKGRCHVPVSVENDAKAAALAELWKGSLADCQSGAVLIFGTAVGGAVICNHRVVRGSHHMAGEFSYMFTNAKEAEDRNQTFAGSCGVPALIRATEQAKGLPEGSLNGEKIFQMAGNGDEIAIKCIKDYAKKIAVQILNCYFVIAPQKIAIGGGISEQPYLIACIREALGELVTVYPHEVQVPEICNCTFYNDANLIGALYTHLNGA